MVTRIADSTGNTDKSVLFARSKRRRAVSLKAPCRSRGSRQKLSLELFSKSKCSQDHYCLITLLTCSFISGQRFKLNYPNIGNETSAINTGCIGYSRYIRYLSPYASIHVHWHCGRFIPHPLFPPVLATNSAVASSDRAESHPHEPPKPQKKILWINLLASTLTHHHRHTWE